jgi:hypothetical protein
MFALRRLRQVRSIGTLFSRLEKNNRGPVFLQKRIDDQLGLLFVFGWRERL